MARPTISQLTAAELELWAASDDTRGEKEAALSAAEGEVAVLTGTESHDAFFQGTFLMWLELARCEPSLLDKISPEMLLSSQSLEVLATVFESFRASLPASERGRFMKGGLAVKMSLSAVYTSYCGGSQPPSKLVSLLEAFGDEFCGKRLGIEDCWGRGSGEENPSVLALAIMFKQLQLTSLILSKGFSPDGDLAQASEHCPLAAAAKSDSAKAASLSIATLELLMSAGASPTAIYSDGEPSLAAVLSAQRPDDDDAPAAWKRENHLQLLRRLFELRPDCASFAWISKNYGLDVQVDAVDCAVQNGADVLRVVLESGGKIEHEYREMTIDGKTIARRPTIAKALAIIANALSPPCLDVLKLLVEEKRVLEGYKERLSDAAKGVIVEALTILAFNSSPSSGAAGVANSAACLEYFLEHSGFAWPWNRKGKNAILAVVLRGLSKRQLRLLEEEIVSLLRRFKRAGFNVKDMSKPDNPSRVSDCQLHHIAALYGLRQVLAFALDEAGCEVDSSFPWNEGQEETAFSFALSIGNLESARLLMSRYGAKVDNPGCKAKDHPLNYLLSSRAPDDDVLSLLQLMAAKEPSLLTPFLAPDSNINPLSVCIYRKLPLCFEWLVSSGLPGVAELATRRTEITLRGSAGTPVLTKISPGLIVSVQGKWPLLLSLLRIPTVSVLQEDEIDLRTTTEFPPATKPSIASMVMAAASRLADTFDAPSRSLVALVMTRAKKEKAAADANAKEEEEERVRAVAAGASVSTFEDPALQAETEARAAARAAKQQAKKKAAKKKAKAKKNVGACKSEAGGDDDSDDDSNDNSSDDDEADGDEGRECLHGEDNLVDTADVPDLTAMLEEARLEREREETGGSKKK